MNLFFPGLGKFFGLQNGNLRKDVLAVVLQKLRRIEDWFLVQQTLAFYASSLLFVYSSRGQGHNSATSKLGVDQSEPHPSTTLGLTEDVGALIGSVCGRTTSASTSEKPSSKAKDHPASSDQRPNQKRVSCGVNDDACHTETQMGTNPKQPKASHVKEGSEGEQPSGEEGDAGLRTCMSDPPLVEVRMIDFAHVFSSSSRDENYLFGLQNLIGFIERLLEM